jgi:hypothetical protein
MSIYAHDDLDDFVCTRQADEYYPWGDREPFDWDEEWAEDELKELLNLDRDTI